MPTEKSNFSRYIIPDPIHPVGDCCICVPVPNSPEYIAQFMGAIWRMSLQTHYERDTVHSGAIVAAKWRAIWQEVQTDMTCCQPTFTDANQQITIVNLTIKLLQQSIRQLWIDADFDIQVAFYATPDNFDTDAGDAGDEIIDRNRALCLAVEGWVDEVFNQGMSFLEATAVDVIPVALGTAFLPVVGQLVSVAIGTALVTFGATVYLQFLRPDYRHYIACTIFENLKGESTGDRAAWDASLDSFPDPRPEPETPIEDAARDVIETWLRSQLNNLDNYLSFVNNLSTAMDMAQALEDEDCGCLGWTHIFDFTIDEQGWTDRTDDDRPFGIYSPGVGWMSEFAGSEIGQTDAERLYIQIADFDVTIIKQINIYYTTTGEQGVAGQAVMQTVLADVVVDTNINTLWSVPSEFIDTWNTNDSCDEIQQSIVNPTGADDSDLLITKIIVKGLGENPFD